MAKKLSEQNKALQGELNSFRDGLINQVPEDRRYVTENMSIENLQKFVTEEQVTANAGKTDSSRAGTTAKGEMGGYDSWEEFASKDPQGAEKALMDNTQGFIR